MDFSLLLRIVVIVYGGFMVYSAIKMKANNRIPQFLLGKGFDIDNAKDQDGFIKNMFVKTLVVGILIFSLGIVCLFSFIAKQAFTDVGAILLIGVIMGIYSIILVKAQEKYLAGLQGNVYRRKKK